MVSLGHNDLIKPVNTFASRSRFSVHRLPRSHCSHASGPCLGCHVLPYVAQYWTRQSGEGFMSFVNFFHNAHTHRVACPWGQDMGCHSSVLNQSYFSVFLSLTLWNLALCLSMVLEFAIRGFDCMYDSADRCPMLCFFYSADQSTSFQTAFFEISLACD